MTTGTKPPSFAVKFITFLAITFCALAVFRPLVLHGWAEWHRLRAGFLKEEGYLGLAAHELEKSVQRCPRNPALYKDLGQIYLQLAFHGRTPERVNSFLDQARAAYRSATHLSPLDAEAFHDLGRILAKQTQMDPSDTKASDQSHESALAAFQEAARLRPHGRAYHYALLRYLDRRQRREEMVPILQKLLSTYPMMFNDLRRNKLCSGTLEDTCRKGLESAIQKGNYPEIAHQKLSELSESKGDLIQAVHHYQRAFELKGSHTSQELIRIGDLYLKAGHTPEAVRWFSRAVTEDPAPENRMEQLYTLLKRKDELPLLQKIHLNAREKVFFSYAMDILQARSLIDQNRLAEAGTLLKTVNEHKPRAEAYYWLARIAELEQNWHQMELAIQKATTYNPRNSRYRQVFAKVLRKLKKVDRAQKQAELAQIYR